MAILTEPVGGAEGAWRLVCSASRMSHEDPRSIGVRPPRSIGGGSEGGVAVGVFGPRAGTKNVAIWSRLRDRSVATVARGWSVTGGVTGSAPAPTT